MEGENGKPRASRATRYGQAERRKMASVSASRWRKMGRGKRSDRMQMQAQSRKKPKRKRDEGGGGQRIKSPPARPAVIACRGLPTMIRRVPETEKEKNNLWDRYGKNNKKRGIKKNVGREDKKSVGTEYSEM